MRPDPGPPPPPAVRAVLAGRPSRLVWANEAGGLTFEVTDPQDRVFVKWAPVESGVDLADEVVRLRWAGTAWAVPRVLDHGSDDTGSWLVTAALPGSNAVTEPWLSRPRETVEALGRGLRALHDTLPVDGCPFGWSAQDRVDDACRRGAAGRLDPAGWHEEHRGITVEEALRRVATPPPVDQLVVCHGDACAPNTLIGADGRWSGHVDLGSLGVADRWADLAVATWSSAWNYGPGWEGALLAAYGVAPDAVRTAYYRLLWDLGP